MTRRFWTNHELAYLRRWYGDKPVTEIARDLRRTDKSVESKAKAESLPAYRGKFSRRRICRDTVKVYGMPHREIAERLGADRSSIRYIARREMSSETQAMLARAGHKKMLEAIGQWNLTR